MDAGMELRQLRYFCAVVDRGNFTRAAEACNVAQPSLSQQILNLEAELGQPLLVRHPRRIELTEAGAAVLVHARRILSESEELRGRLERRSLLLEGSVVVGIIPTVAPFLLPARVAGFLRAHPGVRVRFREQRTAELLEQLVGGVLDFAIVGDVTAADRRKWSLHVRELCRERLLLALPKHHPLARRSSPVPNEAIPREQLMVLTDGHCLADRTLAICRIQRSSDRFECDQLETLLGMVSAGLGVGIVPAMAVERPLPAGVVVRPLEAAEAERTVTIVRRKTSLLSPAAEALRRFFLQ